MDPEAVATVSELLVPDAFYREAHRRIFRAVERLGGARMVVDPTTLTEELRHSGELETIGGMAYIAELLDATPTAANVSYHARIVLDRWTQRRMIEAAGLVAHLGFEPGESVERALDEAQSLVCGIEGDTLGDGLVWTHDAMRGAFADIELRSQCPGGITGVSTGFPDLDELTGGFQGSDLVLVAARPSQGKTAIAVSMALAVAHGGRGVAFFSAEMSKNQIVQRMLCHEARVNLLDMRKGTLDDDAYVQLANVAGPLNTAPLWIDEGPRAPAAARAPRPGARGRGLPRPLHPAEEREPEHGDRHHQRRPEGARQGPGRLRPGGAPAEPRPHGPRRPPTPAPRPPRLGQPGAGCGRGAHGPSARPVRHAQ
jgi:replicative DNA helicase